MPPKKPLTPPALGFFGTLKSSFYSPPFYASIEHRTGGKAFGYFAVMSLLYTIVLGVSLWIGVAQKIDLNPQKLVEHLSEVYPEELVITIQDGTATSNVAEPYFIDIPESWGTIFEEVKTDEKLTHMAVIDTLTPFSVPQFKEYGGVAWLTKDSLYYIDDQNEDISGIELSKFGNIVVNKVLVDEFTVKAGGVLEKLLPTLIVSFALILFVGVLVFESLYLLLLAVFISILRSVLNLPAGFGLSYKTGLYAITYSYTALFIILMINTWAPWNFVGFPFMITLITLAGVGLNLKHLKA